MASQKSQEKIVPVDFGGRRYQVTVAVFPHGFIVKRTVLDGYDSPLTPVLSSMCRDQIKQALGQEMPEVAA
ncbi:MAG: hypothetical protein OEV91_09565 [Desulfobulbaceae bacterium]|nr:hypothetical protein [Desulfobulbaceae bacterium]